jgi:hypothetical protein
VTQCNFHKCCQQWLMIARITLPRYAISAEQEHCVFLGKVHARKGCPFGLTWAGWLGQANADKVAGCANCTGFLNFALGALLTQLG